MTSYTPEFKAVVDKCFDIYNRKGADYTIGMAEIDRLANFRNTAELLGISMFQAWSVHFYKHISAIFAYAKTGKVESEGIEGRLLDVINYAILATQIINEKPNSKQLELSFGPKQELQPLEAILAAANQSRREQKFYESKQREAQQAIQSTKQSYLCPECSETVCVCPS